MSHLIASLALSCTLSFSFYHSLNTKTHFGIFAQEQQKSSRHKLSSPHKPWSKSTSDQYHCRSETGSLMFIVQSRGCMGAPQQKCTLITMCGPTLFSLDLSQRRWKRHKEQLLTRWLKTPGCRGKRVRNAFGVVTWHITCHKNFCMNFLLLDVGTNGMTASAVFNRSTICHDWANCAYESSEVFSAQPHWARCASPIAHLKSIKGLQRLEFEQAL